MSGNQERQKMETKAVMVVTTTGEERVTIIITLLRINNPHLHLLMPRE
jgi:hypothetical protein